MNKTATLTDGKMQSVKVRLHYISERKTTPI
jgi:hypothetical protein